MNKNEFMIELSMNLTNVPEEEKQDILTDYDEYFSVGTEQGRTERDIAVSLGEPKIIAKQLRANYILDKAEDTKSLGNMLRAVLAAIGLGVFNILFLLAPYVTFLVMIVALYVAAFGFTAGGIGIVLGTFLKPIFPQYINIEVSSIISIAIGMGFSALGALMFIGCKHLTEWVYKITIKYLKANIKIINGKEEKSYERV